MHPLLIGYEIRNYYQHHNITQHEALAPWGWEQHGLDTLPMLGMPSV